MRETGNPASIEREIVQHRDRAKELIASSDALIGEIERTVNPRLALRKDHKRRALLLQASREIDAMERFILIGMQSR